MVKNRVEVISHGKDLEAEAGAETGVEVEVILNRVNINLEREGLD